MKSFNRHHPSFSRNRESENKPGDVVSTKTNVCRATHKKRKKKNGLQVGTSMIEPQKSVTTLDKCEMRAMAEMVPETSLKQKERQVMAEMVPKVYTMELQLVDKDNSKSETVFLEDTDLEEEKNTKCTEQELMNKANKKLKKFSELFEKTASIPKIMEDGTKYTAEFLKQLKSICLSYQQLKTPSLRITKYGHKQAGGALVESGNVSFICNLVSEEFKTSKFACEDPELAKNHSLALQTALSVLLNFSDCSDEVTYAIRDHEHILPALLKQLTTWFPAHKAKTLSASEEAILRMCLSVIHNVSMREDNMARLQELKASQALFLYLESHKVVHKISALASLADIATEEEADKLATSPNIARSLLLRLEKAQEAPNHRCYGWSFNELVRAVRRLARNDANKRLLVEKGALPLLVKGIKSSFDDEKTGCMEALWVLSFDKNNVKAFMTDPELLENVVSCLDDGSQPVSFRKAANGLLFQLRDELIKSDTYRTVGERFCHKAKVTEAASTRAQETAGCAVPVTTNDPSVGSEGTGSSHVMLSYQWADQGIVKEIRNCIRNQGFKVWMDIDDMEGSTLQAMAGAIERSFLVVVCMSQKYKDSPNCRAEAEYAFQKRKRIIPLIMQRGYRPDGWLGFILGAKLFYDFSGKYTFESRITQLIRAVQEATKTVQGVISEGQKRVVADHKDQNHSQASIAHPAGNSSAAAGISVAVTAVSRTKSWTSVDIKNWLKEFGLDGTELENLTGREIFFLYNLRNEAPEFFYNTLERKLQITTLSGLIKFTDALSSLSSS